MPARFVSGVTGFGDRLRAGVSRLLTAPADVGFCAHPFGHVRVVQFERRAFGADAR